MKTQKNKILFLIGFFGVFIAFITYMYVFIPYQDKADLIVMQNTQLQTEVTRLETIASNKAKYEQEIQTMRTKIEGFINLYPADILPEDSIMFVDGMEDVNGVSVSSVGFGGASEVVYPGQVTLLATETVANSDVEQPKDVASMDLHMYKIPLSLNIATEYYDFKDLIDYVYEYEDRMNLSAISLSFDHNTGGLNGSITLDTYYLLGGNEAYEESFIPSMKLGVDTVFGNIN